MASSGNVARALEQTKMGLYMLYGAGYFTQDEWMKLDFAFHKGQYEFTSGPDDNNAAANLFDEELISFDEPAPAVEGPTEAPSIPSLSVETMMPEPPMAAEIHSPSPIPSSSADSVKHHFDSPNATSVEELSDHGSDKPASPAPLPSAFDNDPHPYLPPTAAEEGNATAPSRMETPIAPASHEIEIPHDFDHFASEPEPEPEHEPEHGQSTVAEHEQPNVPESAFATLSPVASQCTPAALESPAPAIPETTEAAVEIPKREINVPKEGGLSLGYSKELIEELKAYNSTLNGYKKNTATTSKQISSWASEISDREGDAQGPRSPATAGTIARSWASEVNSPESNQASPVPSHAGIAGPVHDVMASYQRTPVRSASVLSNSTSKSKLIHKHQASSVQPTPEPTSQNAPQLKVPDGTVLTAQSTQVKRGLQLEVELGDKIRIEHFVSGKMHHATNIRTNIRGQVSEDIFRKASKMAPGPTTKVSKKSVGHEALEHQRALAQAIAQQHVRSSSIDNRPSGLDNYESWGAADWDEVATAPKPKKPVVVAPKPKIGGLGASRFACLSMEEEERSPEPTDPTTAMKDLVDRLVDEKFNQIQAAQAARAQSVKPPAGPGAGRGRGRPPPRTPTPVTINPRTTTCWFWAVKNDCRFTAEECVNLHAYTDDPTNLSLRDGRPNWGAVADYLPSNASSTPLPTTPSTQRVKTADWRDPKEKLFAKSKPELPTCYFWAQNGKCHNSDAKCKFVHGPSSAGVAGPPGSNKVNGMAWYSRVRGDREGPEPASLDTSNGYGGTTGNSEWGTVSGTDGWGQVPRHNTAGADSWGNPGSNKGWGNDNDGEVAESVAEGEFVIEDEGDKANSSWGNIPAVTSWGDNNQSGGETWGNGEWGLSSSNAGGEEDQPQLSWGEDPNAYKPPHVRDLEQKERMKALGW